MANRYDDRPLAQVEIELDRGIADAWTKHATPMLSCRVKLGIRALHTAHTGPNVAVHLGIDFEPGLTFADAEDRALVATHELISRLAQFSPDELREFLSKDREEMMQPDLDS